MNSFSREHYRMSEEIIEISEKRKTRGDLELRLDKLKEAKIQREKSDVNIETSPLPFHRRVNSNMLRGIANKVNLTKVNLINPDKFRKRIVKEAQKGKFSTVVKRNEIDSNVINDLKDMNLHYKQWKPKGIFKRMLGSIKMCLGLHEIKVKISWK